MQHDRKHEEASALLTEQMAPAPTINSPSAGKQAKAVVNELFANAGSLPNAVKVVESMLRKPEMRVVLSMIENPGLAVPLESRLVGNMIKFMCNHLSTTGTRYAEDQNILDALLVAVVDEDMMEDRMVKTVATLLGQRWHAVKAAIVERAKRDAEQTELRHGFWVRRKREVREDKFKLPGFYLFQHDPYFFRFSSRRSEPLRNHIGVGEYEVRCSPRHPFVAYLSPTLAALAALAVPAALAALAAPAALAALAAPAALAFC